MKLQKLILILILLCSLSLLSCAQEDPIFQDIDGKTVQITKLKDKWIIVNYWAEWCSACLKEIPELNNFYQKNRDKNIILYGVNFDQLPIAELKQLAVKMRIQFPVLTNDPKLAWHLEATGVLPVTYIINPKGEVVKKIVGPNTEKTLLNTLNELQHQTV